MALFSREKIPDERLIEMLRSDHSDFERASSMLMQHFTGFYHKARKRFSGLPEETVQDAYTDAVIAIIQKVVQGTFDPSKAKLSTLFYQIFFNKCTDRVRTNTNNQNSWERELDEITPELPLPAKGFLRSLFTREDFEGVLGVMDQLRPPCKELILDLDYWGYSPREAAERYEYKNGHSASQAKFRCLDALRKLLDRPG